MSTRQLFCSYSSTAVLGNTREYNRNKENNNLPFYFAPYCWFYFLSKQICCIIVPLLWSLHSLPAVSLNADNLEQWFPTFLAVYLGPLGHRFHISNQRVIFILFHKFLEVWLCKIVQWFTGRNITLEESLTKIIILFGSRNIFFLLSLLIVARFFRFILRPLLGVPTPRLK